MFVEIPCTDLSQTDYKQAEEGTDMLIALMTQGIHTWKGNKK